MRPVLFNLGSAEISSYAVMLSLGACVGFWMTYREVRRRGLPAALFDLTLVSFAAGLIGARGLSWLLQRQVYAGRPAWSILAVWDQGGMSFYGGLTAAAAVGLVFIRLRRLDAWVAADTLVLAWTPFLVFIRVGCFLNGCCFGKPTTFPTGIVAGGAANNVNFGVPSHPTQLYAVAGLAAIYGLLLWLRTRRPAPGQLALVFCGSYSALRFLGEFVRGDTRDAWSLGGLVLTFNQLFSLGVLAVVAALALYKKGAGT